KIFYYRSELLSSSQQRYHLIELEALAIFKCIIRMKSFLLGRKDKYSSSIKLIGTVVTRPKAKAIATNATSASSST
ncbi:unnamed protein product, partial [Rotaria sordida]